MGIAVGSLAVAAGIIRLLRCSARLKKALDLLWGLLKQLSTAIELRIFISFYQVATGGAGPSSDGAGPSAVAIDINSLGVEVEGAADDDDATLAA